MILTKIVEELNSATEPPEFFEKLQENDYTLYEECENGNFDAVFEALLTAVIEAKLPASQYYEIWKHLPGVVAFLQCQLEEGWKGFFNSILKEGKLSLYYAVSLYSQVLHNNGLKNFLQKNTLDAQLLVITVQAILYYQKNAIDVCEMMFELAGVLKDQEEQPFFECCLSKVYQNYPYTAAKIAEPYQKNGTEKQIKLAELILEKEHCRIELLELAKKEPIILGSETRQQAYMQIVQNMISKEEKESEKNSVLFGLFKQIHMKYGIRTGILRYSDEETPYYSAQPLQELDFQVELPQAETSDPIRWAIDRECFVKAREDYIATHHSGVFTTAKRER